LKTRADSLHAQGKEHDFLLDAPGGSHFNAKSDRLLALPFTRKKWLDILI